LVPGPTRGYGGATRTTIQDGRGSQRYVGINSSPRCDELPSRLAFLGGVADELTTSGGVKAWGFYAARLARIAPWYQAALRFLSSAQTALYLAPSSLAKGGTARLLQARFQTAPRLNPIRLFHLLDRLDVQPVTSGRRHDIWGTAWELDLDHPVARYCPSSWTAGRGRKTDPAHRRTRYGLGLGRTTPRNARMTVRDLLRPYVLGLIYRSWIFAYPETGPCGLNR